MIIGVYGYIGTGKTSTCKYIKDKYNFIYINADKIAKKIMLKKITLTFLNKTFPGTVKNGILNSFFLRTIIFTNKIANTKLNNYLWPQVSNKILKIINNNLSKNFLIEAIGIKILPLPFKAKILIKVNKKTILKRVSNRNYQSILQIKKLLKIQKSLFKKNKANYKIRAAKSLEFLYNKIDKIMIKILGEK